MADPLEDMLRAMPGEPMAADLPGRVREELRSYRRREARMRSAARAGTMLLGAGSLALAWPSLAALAGMVVGGIESSAGSVVSGLVEDPGMTLWQLGESLLSLGSEVSVSLGVSGVLALTVLAIPAVLGLAWTLGGRREGVAV